MFFFARIAAFVSSVTRFITNPFVQARSAINNLRHNNPISRSTRQMQSVRRQMQSTVRMPQQLMASLGIRSQDIPDIERSTRRDPKREHKREDIPLIEEVGGSVEKYHQRQLQQSKRTGRSARRAVLYRQIHLVESSTGERHIAHTGLDSGSATAEIMVQNVRLSFSQRRGKDTLPTLLISANPASALQVDGHSDGQPLPLLPHSRVTVKDVAYGVELLTSDDRSMVTHVNAAWETSTGPVRQDNQDAIGIYQHPGTYLFAVADGVGGGYAGDRMSAYAIQYVLKSAEYNLRHAPNWEEIIQRAIQNANLEVRNYMQNVPHQAGTTLTAVVIEQWTATVGHVGDSRLYVLRRGRLQQITQDHARTISIDEENGVRTRTVLSRAIGRDDSIIADTMQLPLLPGDRLLLCTDGISNRLPPDEIQRILQQQTISHAARTLIERANERRNTDNATAVVIDILGHETQREHWHAQAAPRVFVADRGHAPAISGLDDPDAGSGNRNIVRWIVLLLVLALLAAGLWYGSTRFNQPDANLNVQPAITRTETQTSPERQTPLPTAIRTSPTVQATVTLRALPTTEPTLVQPTVIATQPASESVVVPTSTLRVPNQ